MELKAYEVYEAGAAMAAGIPPIVRPVGVMQPPDDTINSRLDQTSGSKSNGESSQAVS